MEDLKLLLAEKANLEKRIRELESICVTIYEKQLDYLHEQLEEVIQKIKNCK